MTLETKLVSETSTNSGTANAKNNQSNTSLISKASSKHSRLSTNSRTSLKRMRKSSFTIVNQKMTKGLKSTGGIKFKNRNTGKANKLLSDFNQKHKVGVKKTEEEMEAEKLENEARLKDAEKLRLATLDRFEKMAAENERKMIKWAEEERCRKLLQEKMENRSFIEKYLVLGTKFLFLVILIVLGLLYWDYMKNKPMESSDSSYAYLIDGSFFLGVGYIVLTVLIYSAMKDFAENHEAKQRDSMTEYELEIRNISSNC